MTVNELIAKLRSEQRAGNGKLEVHVLAHDNCVGETQCTVNHVSFYEKDPDEPADFGGRDVNLYNSLPIKVIYLSN